MVEKPKLFRIATIPFSLSILLKGQLSFLNQYYEVTAIASDIDKETWQIISEREKTKCYPVHIKRDISLWSDIKTLLKLYVFFKNEKPFIVHANTPKASLLSMLAAKFAGVSNRLYTVTGLRFEAETGIKRKILVAMEKLTCWAATKVIPEGRGVKNTLIKNDITKKELKIIANGNINGIDIDLFNPLLFSIEDKIKLRKELKINADSFVFIYIGRIVKDKGINELISTFSTLNSQFSTLKLLLVGPFEREFDPLLPETEKEIQNNANIITAGFQPDIRPYLAISDIFVFPSYREGFPNVVMQAGAMELPCIVSDINGCNEIVEDGVNGLIIPPKDRESLKEKMLLLLNNRDFRMQLKQNARQMITSRYEQRMVWEALLKEYREIENFDN